MDLYQDIVFSLLKQNFVNIRSLTPYRVQNTFLIDMPDGSKYVLKRTKKTEIENQMLAYNLNLSVPKVVATLDTEPATSDTWFLQEYIEAELLEDLYKKFNINYIQFFEKSIDALIKIQNSLVDFEKGRTVPLHCYTCRDNVTYEKFSARLHQQIYVVLEKFPNDLWATNGLELLNKIEHSHAKVSALLVTEDTSNVLIKWDFKPNNVLFDTNKNIFCIDWPGVMKGSCWIDLAFLLYDLPVIDRKLLFEYYCNASNKNSANYKSLTAASLLIGLAHLASNCNLLIQDPVNSDTYGTGIKNNLINLGRFFIELQT